MKMLPGASASATSTATVRDIVNHRDLGTFTGSFTAGVRSHGVVHVNLQRT